eukprot:8699769-Prorocentrum_lima.AAC.1
MSQQRAHAWLMRITLRTKRCPNKVLHMRAPSDTTCMCSPEVVDSICNNSPWKENKASMCCMPIPPQCTI